MAEQEKKQTVREWAAANGYEVKSTGRLSNEIVEAHKAATGA